MEKKDLFSEMEKATVETVRQETAEKLGKLTEETQTLIEEIKSSAWQCLDVKLEEITEKLESYQKELREETEMAKRGIKIIKLLGRL